MTRTWLTLILMLGALPLVAACGRGGDASVDRLDRAAVEAPPEAVSVAANGTRLEPPVPPERLPSGVWYCAGGDCGGAHWAAAEPPQDAACPECRTPLERKETDAPAGGVCAPGGP